MSEPQLRVICMRCSGVIREGDPGAVESHGYCDQCFRIEIEAAKSLAAQLNDEDKIVNRLRRGAA